MDVVYDPDPSNLEAIRSLAEKWGATRPDGSPLLENAFSAGRSVHLSTPLGEIDLLSEETASVSFVNLLERSEIRRIDAVEAPICSLADLVALKRSRQRARSRGSRISKQLMGACQPGPRTEARPSFGFEIGRITEASCQARTKSEICGVERRGGIRTLDTP